MSGAAINNLVDRRVGYFLTKSYNIDEICLDNFMDRINGGVDV